MSKDNKGVVLVIVLGTILVAVLLASAVMHLIINQSRLTHHQISRIQAYYASKAAITYAREQLRTRAWTVGNNCTAATPCNAGNVGLDLVNDFKPASITGICMEITPPGSNIRACGKYVTVPEVCPANLAQIACITCTSTYTYTSP